MSDDILPNRGSIGKGIGIVLGSTFVASFVLFGLTILTGVAVGVGFLGIGLLQTIWILPLWIYYHHRREAETCKGILIMASVIFLLNAGCWGLVATLRF